MLKIDAQRQYNQIVEIIFSTILEERPVFFKYRLCFIFFSKYSLNGQKGLESSFEKKEFLEHNRSATGHYRSLSIANNINNLKNLKMRS